MLQWRREDGDEVGHSGFGEVEVNAHLARTAWQFSTQYTAGNAVNRETFKLIMWYHERKYMTKRYVTLQSYARVKIYYKPWVFKVRDCVPPLRLSDETSDCSKYINSTCPRATFGF